MCNHYSLTKGQSAIRDWFRARHVRTGNLPPLFAFAGFWTPCRGVRSPKSTPVEGTHEPFGFLTTEANAIVAPIHPKAMPVIPTTLARVINRARESDAEDEHRFGILARLDLARQNQPKPAARRPTRARRS